MPRPVVVQQRPGAHVPAPRPRRAVQVLAVVEVPVHRPHHPIQHVARAVAARVAIRLAIFLRPAAQLPDLPEHPRRRHVRFRPLPQPPHPLGERPPGGRMVGAPHHVRQHPEAVGQLAPATDVQPAVQEAPQDGDEREEPQPRLVGRGPAVRAHGSGGVARLHVPDLRLEDAVSPQEVFRPGCLRQRRAKAAARADGGGDVILDTAARLVVLVRQQVLGHPSPPCRTVPPTLSTSGVTRVDESNGWGRFSGEAGDRLSPASRPRIRKLERKKKLALTRFCCFNPFRACE